MRQYWFARGEINVILSMSVASVLELRELGLVIYGAMRMWGGGRHVFEELQLIMKHGVTLKNPE